MTSLELNRDIKRLNKAIKKAEKDNTFKCDIKEQFKSEFFRLYHADNKAEYMNKQSVLIMFRLNLSYRFQSLHLFFINVEI